MPDSSPEEWYRNLPKITRAYMTVAFAATVLVHAELLDPFLIILDLDKVFSQLELWRLLTCFCFFGKFSLPFVLSLFFLVRYGKELETKRFEGRSADMLWFMVLAGLIMVGVSYLVGPMPILSQSMLSSIVYLWSREYSETVISIYGMFNVQAFYFPWVLVAIHVIMGGSAIPDLVGIFAGHVYYFLVDTQGYQLNAPYFLTSALDTPTAGLRQEHQNRNAFGGYQWGGGQRLGGG